MPNNNMAQMLQTIIGLGQLQMSKREQALREQQYETQKEQFAQQFGLQQGDQRFREVSKLLDAITNASHESRGALTQLGGALGLDRQSIDALAQFGQNAPHTIEMLRTIAANRGYMNATQPQQAQMDTEAAAGATTNMNQGQIAASGVTNAALGGGQVAPGTFTPDITGALQTGLGIRTSTGQDPLAFSVGQMVRNNPALLTALAKIQSGTGVSEAEAQQIATQRRGQDVQGQLGMYGSNINLMDLASRTAIQAFTARQGGMVLPGDRLKALEQMAQLNLQSQNFKTTEQENQATTLWNTNVSTAFPELAMPVSQGGLLMSSADDFKKPGLMDKARALVSHSMTPPPAGQPPTQSPFVPNTGFQSMPQYPGFPTPPAQPPQALQPQQNPASPFNFMQFFQQLPAYQPPR